MQWVLTHRATVRKYMLAVQFIVAVVLMSFGYKIGKLPFHLLRHGVATTGTVIGIDERFVRSSGNRGSSWMSYTPTVQINVGSEQVNFKDLTGMSSRPSINERVPVLYDPAQPSKAMVDRGTLNWIVWAWMLGLGAFLLATGLYSKLTTLNEMDEAVTRENSL